MRRSLVFEHQHAPRCAAANASVSRATSPACYSPSRVLRSRVVQTGSISAWLRASRLMAAGFALVLATLLSGAPELASILLEGHGCCESECDGSFGDRGCGPSCTEGSCVKSIVTLPDGPIYELRADVSGDVQIRVAAPDLSPMPSGVFHPPRA